MASACFLIGIVGLKWLFKSLLQYNGDPPRGGFPVFGGLQPNKATVVASDVSGEFPSLLIIPNVISQERQDRRFAK